jgi:predicted transcriptional regulator
MKKTMTLRLGDDQAAELELLARVYEKSQTDVIKDALRLYVDRRRADREFMERLRERHEQESELYERLAEGA